MLRLKLLAVLAASLAVQPQPATAVRYPAEPCAVLSRSQPGAFVICVPSLGPQPASRRASARPAGRPSSYATARQEIPNVDAEYSLYPRYSYNYGVLDAGTGDSKSAWEERDSNGVRGEYTLLEPDGSLRTVSYTADDRHGFRAVITRRRAPAHDGRPAKRPASLRTTGTRQGR